MERPELCVIFNPAAGKKRALARLEQIRRTWGTHADFRPTLHAGHAVELAEQAAREGFAVVAAAGGMLPTARRQRWPTWRSRQRERTASAM